MNLRTSTFSFAFSSSFHGLLAILASCFVQNASAASDLLILKPAAFSHHIVYFNSMAPENYTNFVPNSAAWSWLQSNIPFFECPDQEVEEIYYFRWWCFRKHIVQTTNGFVLTEFLIPVGHAGPFNTISCAVGHHLAEGRWLRDQRYLDDYTLFWLRGNAGKPMPLFHKYSSWFASAVYCRYLVNNDSGFIVGLLDDLIRDYRAWEQEHRAADGLYWQYDVRDGMEESISGSRTNKNLRPTINSYMFANAGAIANIARLAGKQIVAKIFDFNAMQLRELVMSNLWNASAGFFEVRRPDGAFSGAREELGFIPWCFELPPYGYEATWQQLTNREGFSATYGITTAERRSPLFRSHGCCRCEWDGAVWPFATSQTLDALANVLRDYQQSFVSAKDYFNSFLDYTRCQRKDGQPYVGEYLDETTGDWLSSKPERSRYYNHSTFADLLITGVVGLRPRGDDKVEVWPLLPPGTWPWFCLDGVKYHGRTLTIIWDSDGQRYHRGKGLRVLANGREIARADDLARIVGKLP